MGLIGELPFQVAEFVERIRMPSLSLRLLVVLGSVETGLWVGGLVGPATRLHMAVGETLRFGAWQRS